MNCRLSTTAPLSALTVDFSVFRLSPREILVTFFFKNLANWWPPGMSALSVFVGGPNLADQGVLRPPPVVSGLS